MKLDIKTIGYINIFEQVTRAKVKDCFVDDGLVFVVQEGFLGKAIGKKGENVKKLAEKFKQKIRIIGFNSDVAKFVQNLLFPIKGYEIRKEDDKVVISCEEMKLKGQIYGRDRSNLKWINSMVNRYFKDIEVVIE